MSLLRRVVTLLYRTDAAREILANIDEEHREKVARLGAMAARRWYRRQLIGSVVAKLRIYRWPGRAHGESGHAPWGLRHELRHAMRALMAAPGFAVAAVLTLTIAIGATSAIYSVLAGVVLEPLPYAEPHELVQITEDNTERQGVAAATASAWHERLTGVSDLAVYSRRRSVALQSDTGEPMELEASSVSANYFRLLGWDAALGRTFAIGEDQPGAGRVTILSHGLWRRRFGADAGILGRVIRLNGVPFTIAGVMPAAFSPPVGEAQLWTPLVFTPAIIASPIIAYGVTARVPDGVGLERIVEEALLIQQDVTGAQGSDWRTDPRWTTAVVPLDDVVVGQARRPLVLVLVAVAVVLLIACANILNLVQARNLTRRRQFALKAALGAGASRLARQTAAEVGLLGLAGTVGGVLLAHVGVAQLKALAPPGLPRLDTVSVDGGVLLFTALVGLMATAIISLWPAIEAGRVAPIVALQHGTGKASESRRNRLVRHALVGFEAAAVVVLLVATGLLGRSLANKFALDNGIQLNSRYVTDVALSPAVYPGEAAIQRFLANVQRETQTIPGVVDVTVSTTRPLHGSMWNTVFVEGRPSPPDGPPLSDFEAVSADYFATLGVTLTRGQHFQMQDHAAEAQVAIVNEAFARQHFDEADALGRRFGFEPEGPFFRIVGVAADVRSELDASPKSRVYLPTLSGAVPWRVGRRQIIVHVERESALAEILSTIRRLDADLPLREFVPLTEVRSGLVGQLRFGTQLIGGFAAAALALGLVGIYGVTSFSTRQSQREMAIRTALGAKPTAIVGFLVRKEGTPLAVGIGAGVVAAMLLSQMLRGLLFGVGPNDPLTLSIVTLLLAVAGLAAIGGPIRRVLRVDAAAELGAD